MFGFYQSCSLVSSLFTIKFVPKAVIRMALAISLALGISGCVSLPANCFSTLPHAKLVVFGDSYSDTGNLMVDLGHPFEGGRISNGKLAVEHLATHLGTTDFPSYHPVGCSAGYNYSVVGGDIRGSDDGDLLCQVNAYLKRMNDNADASALYFVMMGGNDVRQLDVSLSDNDRDAELNSILDVLFEHLQRLVDAGVMKLMVTNSGDMGRLPSSIASGDGVTPHPLTGFSNRYNVLFNTRMAAFSLSNMNANPLIKIVTFDLFTEMGNVIGDVSFDNQTEGCFDVEASNMWHPDCASGTDAEINKFVYFDSVHATAKAHELLGSKIISAAPP